MTTFRESLVQAVVTRLREIVPAEDNSYQTNFLGGVRRLQQEPQGTYKLPMISVWEEEEKTRNDTGGWACELTVEVTVWAQQAADDETDTFAYLDTLREDVLRALGESITVGTSEYPILSLDEDLFPIHDGEPYIGFTVRPVFRYRIDPLNPAVAI